MYFRIPQSLAALSALVLACTFSLVTAAPIYTWHDAAGVPHYSDQPPANAAARVVVLSASTSPPDSTSSPQSTPSSASSSTNPSARLSAKSLPSTVDSAALLRVDAAAVKRNCLAAKSNLERLNSSDGKILIASYDPATHVDPQILAMTPTDQRPAPRNMDPAARQLALASAKADVVKYCTSQNK